MSGLHYIRCTVDGLHIYCFHQDDEAPAPSYSVLRDPLDSHTSQLDAEDISSGHASHHEGQAGLDARAIVPDTTSGMFTPGCHVHDVRSLHDSEDRPTIDPVGSYNAVATVDDNISNIQPTPADSQLSVIGGAPSVHDNNEGLRSAVHSIASPPEVETNAASHYAVPDTASIQVLGQSVSIRIPARNNSLTAL